MESDNGFGITSSRIDTPVQGAHPGHGDDT